MIEIEGYIENPDTGEQLPFKGRFKVIENDKDIENESENDTAA